MNRLDLRLSACICLLFISILVSPVLAQEGVSFTAEVDRATIATDELLTLTLTVAGEYQQLGEPQLPFMSGFNIVGSSRSSQFSMVNGVVSAQTVFTYRLQPTGAGTFTIDPVTIVANGSTYQTEPLTVQVTQGAAPTQTPSEPAAGQTPSAPAPGALAGQDVYIEADVDNPTPVVGQQIIYRFRFYQAVNLFSQPQLDWPSFSGFWTEDLSPNNVYEQNAAGRRYRITEVRRALFPTAAVQITIEPSKLTIPGDFFSRDAVLETKPVVVDVQPLPQGAPTGFAGAVGQFEIEAWVEPAEARVNEPVTLFVRVVGTGNLTTLPDLSEEMESVSSDWRVYDPQTTTNVGQNDDTIQGEKLFERLLVPKTEGELRIPPFSLVYFDPQAYEYRQIETAPLIVQVAPGENLAPVPPSNGNSKQDVTLLASDIRHIKAAPPSLTTHRTPLLEQPLYWLGWIAPPLALVGTRVWDRRHRRLSSDVAYARAKRARRLARKRLTQARKQAREDDDAAYAAVARALTEYLGDKFNLPSAGLTRDAIRHALTDQAVPDDLIDRSLTCLDWADSGRFAPTPTSPRHPPALAGGAGGSTRAGQVGTPTGAAATGRDASELIAETEAVIAELEQKITT